MKRSPVIIALFCAACVGEPAPIASTDGEYVLVPDGKADDYFSGVAIEYQMSGTVELALDPGIVAVPEAFEIFVANRVTAVGVYLSAYLSDKIHGEDQNGDGQISGAEVINENFGYGGFHAMVRNHTVDPGDLREISEGRYEIDFELQVAGPVELFSALPGTYATDGAYVFDFVLPLQAFDSAENTLGLALSRFDPAAFEGELVTVTIEARALANAENAYPRFDAFAADGVVDVTLAFGYDDGATRADLTAANEVLATLISMGFETPTYIIGELGVGGGPLTRTMTMNGREVRVEVRLLLPDPFVGDPDGHRARVLMELRDRDIFMYVGHAGAYSGFNLGPDGTAVIEPADIRDAVLSDRQQLVVAQGCKTYSQYADMLYANVAKTSENLDVITTVNFGYWRGTGQLIRDLFNHVDGHHLPQHYGLILHQLNQVDQNQRRSVLYGVHGIEDNPGLHPYADPSVVGRECTSQEACGDPAPYLCMGRCVAWAVRPGACPDGSRYLLLAQGNTAVANVCTVPF